MWQLIQGLAHVIQVMDGVQHPAAVPAKGLPSTSIGRRPAEAKCAQCFDAKGRVQKRVGWVPASASSALRAIRDSALRRGRRRVANAPPVHRRVNVRVVAGNHERILPDGIKRLGVLRARLSPRFSMLDRHEAPTAACSTASPMVSRA